MLQYIVYNYFLYRKLRTSIHGQILINLSLALMGLYILFIIGGSAVPIPAVCGISSGLLHYFILVFFGWTTVEAIWLYLKIVKVLGTHTYEVKFILKAGLPTWCKYSIIYLMLVLCVCVSVTDVRSRTHVVYSGHLDGPGPLTL